MKSTNGEEEGVAPPQRGARRAQHRQRILDAARTVFFRDGAHNPSTVPAVMALLACLLADHLEEVAVGQEAAQTVFCNHIRCFFYHGLPFGSFPA